MSIAFTCPQCGKAFQVDDSAAGKKARCKRCGLSLQVPRSSGQKPMIFGTPVDEPPPARAPAHPRPKPRPRTTEPAVADPYGLDEAADPGFEVLEDDEPTLAARPAARSREQSQSRRSGAWQDLLGSRQVVGAAVAGGAALVLLLVAWHFWSRPRVILEPRDRTTALPAMPERPARRELEPGIFCEEVVLGSGHGQFGGTPGHAMTMWLYLPPGEHSPGSLPCVLIAPAGSLLVTGMQLRDGDRPEHLPWVRAGFAVLAYELDGELASARDPIANTPEGDLRVRTASAGFLVARAGLTNAEVALAWLAARVPEVNPKRIYTAGHSSAGTMALLLAEHDPRIKACAAFAPCCDIATRFSFLQKMRLRNAGIEWLEEFNTRYNPKNHAAEFSGPVFLFHARDDSVLSVSETEAFAADLQRLGKQVELAIVPTGDHYDSMIEQGVPRAITWLRGIDQGR